MAKHQAYKYQGEGVSLEFCFPEGEKGDKLKRPFIELLKQAQEELENEQKKPN